MTNDKLTGLALILAISVGLFAPATAQARTYHKPHITKYGYTVHRHQHLYCPYTGCKKDFVKH
jgi:hypothetical protein